MTNMNEKINNLKTSIKKSNEAAQAKVLITILRINKVILRN